MKRFLFIAFVLVSMVVPAWAQAPTNPNTVAFTSTDHNATGVNDAGQPVQLVTRYLIEVLPVTGTTPGATPVRTQDIGKPALTNNEVVYSQFGTAVRPLLADGTYAIRVVAEGPGGRTASAPSAPFSVVRPTLRPPTATGTPIIRNE